MSQSPFTAAAVAAAASPLFEVRCHQGKIYWATRRSREGGRQVVMQYNPDNQQSHCLTPEGFSAQSRVHEYGGGCYAVGANAVFFVNGADQCIYQQTLDSDEPIAITKAGARYGDITVAQGGDFLVVVREQHNDNGVINDLVRIDLATHAIDVLASGADFYAAPALNSDDSQLVFLSWSHPNMPWDKTTLWQLDLASKELSTRIDADEAIYQPGFTPDDQLFYVSDRSGWWNVYADPTDKPASPSLRSALYARSPVDTDPADKPRDVENMGPQVVENMGPRDVEGVGGKNDCGYPMWVLGTNHVVFADQQAWFISGKPGEQIISNSHGKSLDLPFSDFQPTLCYNAATNSLYFIAGCYNQPDALYSYHLGTHELTCLAKSAEHNIDPSCFAKPQPIQIEHEGKPVFGFYYPPTPKSLRSVLYARSAVDMDPADKPRDVEGVGPRDVEGVEENTPPPLIVNAHGGPNGSATTQCQFKIQFWTSRGFAYLDVNYRGSTGYGRTYRRALDGAWGVADVDDCCALTRYCVDQGLADRKRLFIRGQSAGGLTALAACVFHSLFAGGVSCYGVADLTTLLDDTHKFECRYLDKLVGPYPDARERYLARSPAYHLDQLDVPLLFLQGLEDRVVPVEQTQAITDKLDIDNKPYTYVEFANEGHGFKRAENIIQAMEAELAFYLGV
jgi:dipeptidyl aminopeptidase/acylaminoacyl peptidase